MNTSEVALTEFSDLDADELHLVKRAATGFPALLAKSVAAEIEAAKLPIEKPRKTKLPKYVQRQVEAQRTRPANIHQQENTTVKKPTKAAVKSLRKSARQIMAKSAARHSLQGAVAKASNDALQHIRQLEREVAAKGSGQDAWGAAFLLNRARADLAALERVRKAVPNMNDFASVDRYMANPAAAEAAASRASTAGAIGGVQGTAINRPRLRDVDVLRGVLDGTGEAETLQTFEIQTRKLEKALADATSPQERESLGYQVTRRKLLAMHMRGEGCSRGFLGAPNPNSHCAPR
jgi:hypothetical protein